MKCKNGVFQKNEKLWLNSSKDKKAKKLLKIKVMTIFSPPDEQQAGALLEHLSPQSGSGEK